MAKENFGLVLVYRNGRKVLPLASVADPRFIQRAAKLAVTEAEERAKSAAGIDPALGVVHAAETNRLREIFSELVEHSPRH